MYDFGTGLAQMKYGAGGQDFEDTTFKFQEGVNRIRILAVATGYLATHFISATQRVLCAGIDEGCPWHGENAPVDDEGNPKPPALKKLAYISVRENGHFGDPQLAYLPYSVAIKLEGYSASEDWEYDGMPMPYDVVVVKEKKGKLTKYQTDPTPKRNEIPADIMEALAKKKPLDEIAEAIKAKQAKANHLGSPDLPADPPGFGGHGLTGGDGSAKPATPKPVAPVERKIPDGAEGRVVQFALAFDPALEWWDKTKFRPWLMSHGGYKPGASWEEIFELLEKKYGITSPAPVAEAKTEEIPF